MFDSMPTGSVADNLVMAIFLLLGIVVATAVWVYRDAKAFATRGVRITSSVGSMRLNSPRAWFIACLVLWEMALPLYLESRSSV